MFLAIYNAPSLTSKEFLEKYGTLTEGQNLSGISGRYWTVIMLTRWNILALVLVVLRDYYYFQVASLLAMSVMTQALIIVGEPLAENVENKMLMFNELMCSLYLYLLLLLSMGQQSNNSSVVGTQRENIGSALLAVVSLTFLVNVLKMLLSIVGEIRKKLR